MTETFILDPDYIDYTPEKLKYESLIPKKLSAFIEDTSVVWFFMLPHLIGLPIIILLVTWLAIFTSPDTPYQAMYYIAGTCVTYVVVVMMIFAVLVLWGRAILILSLGLLIFGTLFAIIAGKLTIEVLVGSYVVYSILALIIMGAVYLTNLNQYLRLRNRCVRMVSHGVVIDGELIEATGTVKHTNNDYQYHVTVRYQYMTLSGYEREGVQSCIREDLWRKELPCKGTPVSVLYADEDAVMML